MLKPLLLFLAGMAAMPVRAQMLRYPVAARYPGLGAYSYHFIDVFSCTANQAALARLERVGGGVYAESRFLQEALKSYTATVALPTRLGGWGVTARYMGSGQYNESQVSLAYGKKLGQVDLGVQFNYAMLRAAGYGSDGAATVEIGTIWHITDRVHTGVHLFNPTGSKFGKQGQEKLAWVYTMGGGYEVSDKLLISADIIKAEDKPADVQAGLQYTLDRKFFFRAGMAAATAAPWLGAGWAWQHIRVDISGSYHPQLGVTPGLMLIFMANKDSKP
jgi:hypothetical protein